MAEVRALKVVVMYGNPKQAGFVHGCLDRIAARLEERGVSVHPIRLLECDLEECAGCFTCLRTGACRFDDDLGAIPSAMRGADGFVIGGSVRNGYFPALYKRFYERVTYLIGFTRDLRNKPVLAVGAVGMAGGKRHLREVLTLRGFQTVPAGFLFFRTGIPGRLAPADVEPRLLAAADRFLRRAQSGAPASLPRRVAWKLDDWILRTLMLRKNPDGVYDYIINQWREKGML